MVVRLGAEPLPPEDVDDEYFALGVEVWFGLWKGHKIAGNGEYRITSREEMKKKDPELYRIISLIFDEKD